MTIPSTIKITSPIKGVATFTRNGLFYDAVIQYDNAQPIDALAFPVGGRIAIAFGPKDKMEIGAYTIAGNRATSLWIPPAAKGESLSICGQEKLIKRNETIWNIEEARSIDGSSYSGYLEIAPLKPGMVGMTWNLADGKFESVGLKFDDAIFSCWNVGDAAEHGIIVLDPQGSSYNATIITKGQNTLRNEVWAKD